MRLALSISLAVGVLGVSASSGAVSTHPSPLATNPAARELVIFALSWEGASSSGREQLVLKTDRRAVLDTTRAFSLEVPTEKRYRFRLRPRTYERVRAALAGARLRTLRSEYESPNAETNEPTYTIRTDAVWIDVQQQAIDEGRVPARLVSLIRRLDAVRTSH
jgi:hypothetical protein